MSMIRVTLLAVFVINIASVFAQDEPAAKNILRGMYIEPKAGKVKQLERGLADHMVKHHPADGWQIMVWSVETGKRVGQYFYHSTAHSWEDFDTRVISPRDDPHWQKYVMAYTEKVGPNEFWRFLPDVSILGEKDISKSETNLYHIRAGGQKDFIEFMAKLKPALQETGDPYSYGVYIKESGGYIPVISIEGYMEGWKDMEPFSTDVYEAMANKYGEEEANDMFDKVYTTIKWVDNEVLTLRLDLSTQME